MPEIMMGGWSKMTPAERADAVAMWRETATGMCAAYAEALLRQAMAQVRELYPTAAVLRIFVTDPEADDDRVTRVGLLWVMDAFCTVLWEHDDSEGAPYGTRRGPWDAELPDGTENVHSLIRQAVLESWQPFGQAVLSPTERPPWRERVVGDEYELRFT